jgi:hypothetical protein
MKIAVEPAVKAPLARVWDAWRSNVNALKTMLLAGFTTFSVGANDST